MKLYTEEQVREAYNRGRTDWINEIESDNVLSTLTPIELPSDEEIDNGYAKSELNQETLEAVAEKLAKDFPHYLVRDNMDDNDIKGWFLEALQKGAKWMKEQILNQNK